MPSIHLCIKFAKKRHLAAKDGEIKKLGFEGIVEISGVVGNFIYPIDELGFERRAQIQKIFGELRKIHSGIIARMFNDAFANLKREIQPTKIQIAMLKLLDDAKGLQIVIKATAVRGHQFVELAFAGVAKRRVPNIVYKSEGLGKLGVQAERGGNRAGDLRDSERKRQAIAEVVGITGGEDLCFGFETAESAGMDDAVAVARVVTAVGMCGFRVAPAARLLGAHRQGSKSGDSIDGPLRCFRLIHANGNPRNGSGFRRNRVQTAIGLVRHGGIRKFFLDLLVECGGFLRIGLAQQTRQFQEDQRTRHEHGRLVG